jgi:chaperone required for assembly of F1-ATPase
MEENEASRIQDKIKQERKPQRLKKFFKKATVSGRSAPFGIKLDGRQLKTPLKATLALPTRVLARKIADEWNAQGEIIELEQMFLNKYANTVTDRVESRREDIVNEIVAFASSDLVCYRAESPQGLVERQGQAWDPILKWAEDCHQLNFVCVAGIIYATQPEKTLVGAYKLLDQRDSYALTAIHNLTTLTGSALIAIAVTDGFLSDDEAWDAAHVDEDWNIEQWGSDDDAVERRKFRRKEFGGILEFHRLAQKK